MAMVRRKQKSVERNEATKPPPLASRHAALACQFAALLFLENRFLDAERAADAGLRISTAIKDYVGQAHCLRVKGISISQSPSGDEPLKRGGERLGGGGRCAGVEELERSLKIYIKTGHRLGVVLCSQR